jgi:hypothetical protein
VTSLFSRDGAFFLPSRSTRSAWDTKFLHGGPTATLLAHAVAQASDDPELLPARLTIDLFRPVPQSRLGIASRTVRRGKRLAVIDATISADGVAVARGAALLLRHGNGDPASVTLHDGAAIPPWESLPDRHWLAELGPEPDGFYHTAIEVRCVTAPQAGTPLIAWVRIPFDFLPGRKLTPFERVAATCDFANAIGQLSRAQWRGFINADISLHLFRLPEGEWLCLEGAGRGDAAGVATSTVNLHDSRGLIGHIAVSCLANELPAGVRAATARAI